VGAKYVIEMNMKPYIPWLVAVGVRCRAAGCASRKRHAARLALSSGMGGGEWLQNILRTSPAQLSTNFLKRAEILCKNLIVFNDPYLFLYTL
jgi:hypothetical protein